MCNHHSKRNHAPGVPLLLLAALLLLALLLPCCAASTPPDVLVRERCTECHTLAPVEVTDRDLQEWEAIVYRMIAHGARLGDRDARRVIEYLNATHGTP